MVKVEGPKGKLEFTFHPNMKVESDGKQILIKRPDDERLNRALGHYRMAVAASSPETDKAIMSRAYESMGRINAFLENPAEAVKQFDEAIKLGDVRGGAYREALEGKKKLANP